MYTNININHVKQINKSFLFYFLLVTLFYDLNANI